MSLVCRYRECKNDSGTTNYSIGKFNSVYLTLCIIWSLYLEEYWPPKDGQFLIPKTCYHVRLHDKWGYKLHMELRLLISWHYDMEIILYHANGPKVITSALYKSGRGRHKQRSDRCDLRTWPSAAGFGEGGSWTKPRTASGSGGWKRQGNRISSGADRRSPALGFSPVRPTDALRPAHMQENQCVCCFKTHKIVVICYTSNWKLMQS